MVITDVKESVIDESAIAGDTIVSDVRTFHLKFNLLAAEGRPVHLTKRKLRERIECMQEELDEFKEAAHLDDDEDQDMPLMADALVDLTYFMAGTAVMMGLPFGQLWSDVHNANMRKERGISHRGHKVDCVKPAGWVGPQTLSILEAAGYLGYPGESACIDDAADQ